MTDDLIIESDLEEEETYGRTWYVLFNRTGQELDHLRHASISPPGTDARDVKIKPLCGKAAVDDSLWEVGDHLRKYPFCGKCLKRLAPHGGAQEEGVPLDDDEEVAARERGRGLLQPDWTPYDTDDELIVESGDSVRLAAVGPESAPVVEDEAPEPLPVPDDEGDEPEILTFDQL